MNTEDTRKIWIWYEAEVDQQIKIEVEAADPNVFIKLNLDRFQSSLAPKEEAVRSPPLDAGWRHLPFHWGPHSDRIVQQRAVPP